MAFLTSLRTRFRTIPAVALLLLSFAYALPSRVLAAPPHPRPADALGGSMKPNTGIPAGGTAVVITGHGFSTAKNATLVQFHFSGRVAAAKSIDCTDAETCIITTPPSYSSQAPLPVPVTITVNGMTASVGTFIYQVITPPPPPLNFCTLCVGDGGHCVKKGNQTVCIGRR